MRRRDELRAVYAQILAAANTLRLGRGDRLSTHQQACYLLDRYRGRARPASAATFRLAGVASAPSEAVGAQALHEHHEHHEHRHGCVRLLHARNLLHKGMGNRLHQHTDDRTRIGAVIKRAADSLRHIGKGLGQLAANDRVGPAG